MFDIAPSEFLLTAIVAIVVIGPKDMPLALRTAGRWIGKMRRMSNHLRSGFDAMIREAEMEEMERKWREQNQAIMSAHPAVVDPALLPASGAEPVMMPLPASIDYPAATPNPVPATIEQAMIAPVANDAPPVPTVDTGAASDGATHHVAAAPYPP